MTKTKIILPIIFLLAAIAATGWFFSHYQLKVQAPVKIKLATPIYWIPRVMAMNVTIIDKADPNVSPLTPIQQYICNKFGQAACPTALAISMAESHDNCNEINVNSNGTVDFSIFMENSVHLNKQFTLTDLSSCERMVDRAYDLYKAQGWTPWVSYQTKAYLKFLY